MTEIDYGQVIEKTKNMVFDATAKALVQSHGLQILDVTWEDTGRFKDSCVGPNISDMTIQVAHGGQLHCMPVIRFPNFSDTTGDVLTELLSLMVGNEKGEPLRRVGLKELLEDLRVHLHRPSSWAGERESLVAPERDGHVLVSAQACFLPIPQEGRAEFNPVLFNYQSVAGDPAVLTILATREGTSVTVIDNDRDGFSEGGTWGQRLFFNHNGERASFTGQRKSEFLAEAEAAAAASGEAPPADREGLNMVLLIQVPLKQKNPPSHDPFGTGAFFMDECCDAMGAAPAGADPFCSDVEEAVIGHGEVEGPFTEIDDLEIERDDRFPVRVTVQFYKATSNGVISEQDALEMAEQIQRVYDDADYVGSLVVEGETGRPTEYHGATKQEPAGWWPTFWRRLTR